MADHSRPGDRRAAFSLRDYRGVLWGTVALVALNVALAIPSGASKVSNRQAALVEKSMDGNDGAIDSGDGSKDIMTELAAAPVSNKVLSKLRGGYQTKSGMEISVGFDFRTLVNGQLAVHNIFNVLGGSQNPEAGATQTASLAIKQFGAAPAIVEKLIPVPPSLVGNPVTKVASAASNIGGLLPQPGAQPQAIAPIVINQFSNGKVTLVNEIGPGTTVTNSLDGGRASTVIRNVADGITIEQFTSLTIGITTPSQFVSKVRSGQILGLGRDVSNVWRSALIGAIAK